MPKKPAKRPTPRTVHVVLEAPFEGWEADLRADFPLRILKDLGSDEISEIGGALDRLVVTHNFPDSDDNLAASMLDVDPYDAIEQLARKYTTGLSALPPR